MLNLRGDIIGGRLWPNFGLGVADVALRDPAPNNVGWFSHNEYWAANQSSEDLLAGDLPDHVVCMRAALALASDPDLDAAEAT